MPKTTICGLFLALLLGLVPAQAEEAASRQVLTFNNGAEPETLDPHLMTGVPEHTLALALFEGLTSHDPKTLEPRPGMATRWELSEDGTVYTFHLREGSFWVDGTGKKVDPVTAGDFVYAWRRAVNPETRAQYAYQLYPIKNGRAIAEGKLEDFTELGVIAPDDHTLIVTLEAPCAYFLDLTSFETLMPVHPPTVERFKALGVQQGNVEVAKTWAKAGNIVTNGPYYLHEWEPRHFIKMRKNTHWWNAEQSTLVEITALPLEDLDTAYNYFLDGRCDWLKAIPLPKIEEIKRKPDYYVTPYLGNYFYGFNVKQPPFDDVRVRKAFNLAVNKDDICKDVLRGGQIPATGYVPPGIHGYSQLQGMPYDPKLARELLAAAGYKVPGSDAGEDFPEVELLYNTSEQHRLVAEAVVKMWHETLGARVKLRNTEWKVYLDLVDNLQFQVARRGWIGDYTDPNTFMDMFVSGGGNNNTGWSNKQYDELIEAAARELDPEKRFELFRQAERMLCVDDLPILPLYYYVNQGMLAEYVQGWEPNIRDLHPFQYISIDLELFDEIKAEREGK